MVEERKRGDERRSSVICRSQRCTLAVAVAGAFVKIVPRELQSPFVP